MNQRTFARPICDQRRPGLELVSPGHRFFIYAEKLIALCDAPGQYRVIKRRDKHPEKAVGYHPGEIIGRLDIEKGWARICLFLGECGQSIEPDGKGGFLNVVREPHHSIPLKELELFVSVLTLVLRQREDFDATLSMADSLPSWLVPDDRNEPE